MTTKLLLRSILLIGLVSISGAIASAQVATGLPPFASFSGNPDTVNLANLNVHIPLALSTKAGRQLPFSYAWSYDSSIWTPVGSSGSQVWAPADFSFLGTTYYMDGVEVPANVALGALSADSASPCPNGTCNGFGTNGQGQVAWVQFYSFAGGVSGYFNPSDLTAGIAAGIYPAPTLGGSQTQGAATNMEWSKPSSTSLSPLFPAPFPIVTASKPFQTAVRDCVNELKQLAKQLAESDSPSQVFQACMQTSGFWPE